MAPAEAAQSWEQLRQLLHQQVDHAQGEIDRRQAEMREQVMNMRAEKQQLDTEWEQLGAEWADVEKAEAALMGQLEEVSRLREEVDKLAAARGGLLGCCTAPASPRSEEIRIVRGSSEDGGRRADRGTNGDRNINFRRSERTFDSLRPCHSLVPRGRSTRRRHVLAPHQRDRPRRCGGRLTAESGCRPRPARQGAAHAAGAGEGGRRGCMAAADRARVAVWRCSPAFEGASTVQHATRWRMLVLFLRARAPCAGGVVHGLLLRAGLVVRRPSAGLVWSFRLLCASPQQGPALPAQVFCICMCAPRCLPLIHQMLAW
ncbi:unnamed protein product [Prorocentrum cordatum]|uniref:Uncharacterized protein n=1 Tax=Prorocentrum cordatum TaxID=2364126 RepID=A0ABN9VKZ0_9DINO|nr:unnamed protein product [Polarella glacialis]